jgi:MOSC domain-containing protein YiiM
VKILFVNVGLPREVLFRGEHVRTAIFKEPVEGQIKLRKLNLDGFDRARRERQSGIRIPYGTL